jgi:hypothetical protein
LCNLQELPGLSVPHPKSQGDKAVVFPIEEAFMAGELGAINRFYTNLRGALEAVAALNFTNPARN